MNNLESKFKNALESHEVDYDPQAWASFKGKLDATPSGAGANGGSGILTKLGIAATVIGTISIGVYFLTIGDSAEKTEDQPLNSELIQEAENSEIIHLENNSDKSIQESAENSVVEQENNIEASVEEGQSDAIAELPTEPYKANEENKADEVVEEGFTFADKHDKVKDQETPDQELVSEPVKQNLNSNFTINKTSGCQGMVCEFKPEQLKGFKGDVIWNFGDGTVSNERFPKHTFNKPGHYTVRLTLQSKVDGNIVTDFSEEFVTIYEKPDVDFEIEETAVNSAIPEFKFVNNTNNANNWSWTFGDQSASSAKESPFHTYRKKGVYRVQLTATNSFGCKSSKVKNVSVEDDYNLLAPTAFTPNGDGRNDYFIPRALEIMDADFTMSVFHKNGQLYYETNQVSRPWDGRYMKDNQNAPGGAYVWIVKMKTPNGETEVYRGSVTLLRD